MHANRPFMLGYSSQPHDSASDDSVSECITASKMTLETVEGIVDDGNLFHAFWWTPYATFCALAVVYVWEIQHKGHGRCVSDDPSLFELAERCHSRLAQSSSTHSPGPRYSIILEELRLEAKQGGPQLSSYQAANNHTGETTMSMSFSDSLGNLQQGPGTLGLDLDPVLNDVNATFFPPLNEWQVADWLDLDSSVSCYGLLP